MVNPTVQLSGALNNSSLLESYQAENVDISGTNIDNQDASTSYSGTLTLDNVGSDGSTVYLTFESDTSFAITGIYADSALTSETGTIGSSSDTFTYQGVTFNVSATTYSDISVTSASAISAEVTVGNGDSATTSTVTYFLDSATTTPVSTTFTSNGVTYDVVVSNGSDVTITSETT